MNEVPQRRVLSRPMRLATMIVAAVALAGMLIPTATASLAGADVVEPPEWTATWIGRDTPLVRPKHPEQNPAPLLRREFDLDAQVAQARLSIVGLGYYVGWINAQRVGDQVLDPPPSQYNKTAFSRSFDVTQLMSAGRNAIGVELGRSYFASPQSPRTPDFADATFGLSTAKWWQEPRLLAQLDITLTDGTTRRIVSDGRWKIADGPTRDALFYGELYDAHTQRLLPLSPQRHRRALVYILGDQKTFYDPTGPFADRFVAGLRERGLEVEVRHIPDPAEINRTPLDAHRLHHDFDVCVYFANLAFAGHSNSLRVSWTPWQGPDAPRHVATLPTAVVSIADPYLLQDVPMIKTAINGYTPNDDVVDVCVATLFGEHTPTGTSPVDPFAGHWDAAL